MTTSPGGGGPLRLKDWLLAQVESGQYPGLGWEDREQRLFRIPWKHASKQDYCQHEDAALFKVLLRPPTPSPHRRGPGQLWATLKG